MNWPFIIGMLGCLASTALVIGSLLVLAGVI